MLLLLGAKGKFSGGFDISAFGGIQEAKGTLTVLGVFLNSNNYIHTHFLILSSSHLSFICT